MQKSCRLAYAGFVLDFLRIFSLRMNMRSKAKLGPQRTHLIVVVSLIQA